MKAAVLLIISLFLVGNPDSRMPKEPVLPHVMMKDVAYGTHVFQKMDVYLPEGRDKDTKVFVVVHGGAWKYGFKEEMDWLVTLLQERFPNHAIVNINYRLADNDSPAFPKQIEDIEAILQFLKNSDYNISQDYAFIGMSAGAHLSMLYAYKYDISHDIKAVCSIVGPADFTDPSFNNHYFYPAAALNLLGTETPTQEQIIEINPCSHITAQAPPTLMLYGAEDPVIPETQGLRLKSILNSFNVESQLYIYPFKGHDGWETDKEKDAYNKLTAFMKQYF